MIEHDMNECQWCLGPEVAAIGLLREQRRDFQAWLDTPSPPVDMNTYLRGLPDSGPLVLTMLDDREEG